MSLDGEYDPNNIFAMILRGDLPCHMVYEDDETLAFLDINPQETGHCLVISKWSRARNLLEIEPEAICQVMASAKRVAIALRKALAPDGFHIAQFNGGETGQSVFHLHVHIVPRWKDRDLGILAYYDEEGRRASDENLRALAAKIRAHMDIAN